MRKELSETSYAPAPNGDLRVRARTPESNITKYTIDEKDLILDIPYLDEQGNKKTTQIMLQPVTSQAMRVDKILPSEVYFFILRL